MTNNQKISPIKNNPLRRAGQSLDEKIINIIFDKVLPPVIIIFFLFAMALIEWIRVYFKVPYMPWVYTVIFLVVGAYYLIKIKPELKHIKDLGLGRDGEIKVAEILEELKPFGYKVFHDIIEKDKKFNIDHVIVGPAGVFTVETKTYSKQSGNPRIYYDGVSIKIEGLTKSSKFKNDPIDQAKLQMRWLSNFIYDNAKIKVMVRPVVVFPGWFVVPDNRNAEVLVLNVKILISKLKESEKNLSEEQINLISSHIEVYNRNN